MKNNTKRNNTKKNSNKLLKGGLSARPGTINLKCPNMDCGTAGLPGFHPSWGKVGGFREYLKYKKLSKSIKRINKKKTTKRKTFYKKGGKGKIGPYLSIDNHDLPSYSRYGAPGTRQEWKGGINLN